ncbi:MAG TPA: acyl-CoA dehydrogenase family protein [Thermodesulfobacteriota bacterium]|nr:acyl-CoA dehydrogenase family protein [Thermodesulfobacteriota bacterium]
MNNLLTILDSFQPGWKESQHVHDFKAILKEMVIPSYPFLEARIENQKAQFPKEWDAIIAALKEAHILELFVPQNYGGRKTSETDIYCLMELFGYASPGLGIIFVSHGRAVDIVVRGSEAQKKEYLPRMAAGQFGAIAMTEEKAGSDASAIGLMAARDDRHYLLTGEKIFISNSGLAEIYTILVNTKGIKGPRSLSAFIVEKDTPDFYIDRLPEKDGLKVLPTGRLKFSEARVPAGNRVGEEGSGLILTMDVIDQGRIHIAGICCGLAYRIFREIYHYAQRRRQFDHPLTSSQDIGFQIAEMYSKMNAARGLCFHALGQIGSPYYRLSSSLAKLFATQMVMDVAARAQVLMGGRGYLRNDLINQLAADARGMEYLEGTSNIQKMIITRELNKLFQKERGENMLN